MSLYGVHIDKILNRPLAGIDLSGDKQQFVLRFQDGEQVRYGVEGDCCSVSWVEYLTIPAGIDGQVITGVEELEMEGEPTPCVNCRERYRPDEDNAPACNHDVLQVYQTHFHTPVGDIILEYRNDSNGYYGGYLEELS